MFNKNSFGYQIFKKTWLAKQICTQQASSGVFSRHRQIFHCSLGFKYIALDSQVLASTKWKGFSFLNDKVVFPLMDKYMHFSIHNPGYTKQ